MKDKILKEIRSGEVVMTPRLYLLVKVIAVCAVGIAIGVVSIFIFGFIFFSIRLNNHDALLQFGPRGIESFLLFFPWHLLLLDILLVVLLRYLLRRFHFAYAIPVLYFVAMLFLASVALGFALDRGTPFNDRLLERHDRLPPPLAAVYEHARRPLPRGSGICRCEIIAINGNKLTVADTREGTTTLTIIVPNDDLHATTTGLSVGDIVFIAGREENGELFAFGIHKEIPGEPPPLPPGSGEGPRDMLLPPPPPR